MDKLTQIKTWALSRATLWSGYMHKEGKKERKKERQEDSTYNILNILCVNFRFCENDGSKRSKINGKGGQLDWQSRWKLIQNA